MRQRLGFVGPVSTDRAGVSATSVERCVDLVLEPPVVAATGVEGPEVHFVGRFVTNALSARTCSRPVMFVPLCLFHPFPCLPYCHLAKGG